MSEWRYAVFRKDDLKFYLLEEPPSRKALMLLSEVNPERNGKVFDYNYQYFFSFGTGHYEKSFGFIPIEFIWTPPEKEGL